MAPSLPCLNFSLWVHDRNLNKKSLEALIMTGALDSFGERGQMYNNIETLLTFNKEQVAEKESAQESLFGLDSGIANTLNLNESEPASKIQKLIWEKELPGVYVSGHPLDEFADELAKRPSISEIKKKMLSIKKKLRLCASRVSWSPLE